MPLAPLSLAEPIRLFAVDLDNTLNPPEREPLNLGLLTTIQERNRASQTDPTVPPLTIITGRPQQYLEAMLQAVDGRLPGIFEHGFGMYDMREGSIATHPSWTPANVATRRHLAEQCEEQLVKPGYARIQLGKRGPVTMIPLPPHTWESLATVAHEIAAENADTFEVHLGPLVIDFLPKHVHKGTGIQWLSTHLKIPAPRIAAMGDSTTDALMFSAVGLAIAPFNASYAVKEAAHWIAPEPYTAGVLAAYDACIAHNRRLA